MDAIAHAARDRSASRSGGATSYHGRDMPFVRPLVPCWRGSRATTPAITLALLDKALDVARLAGSPHATANGAAPWRAGRRRACDVRGEERAWPDRRRANHRRYRRASVEVITGGASLGQGFETVMAQICAETLGVDYRKVRVVHGQTDRIDVRHRRPCLARNRDDRRRRRMTPR